MKTKVAVTWLLSFVYGSVLQAQSVSSRAPVISANYVTASSPVGQGRVVTSYRPIEGSRAVTTVSSATTATPTSARIISYSPTSTYAPSPIATTVPSSQPAPYAPLSPVPATTGVPATPYYSPTTTTPCDCGTTTLQPIVNPQCSQAAVVPTACWGGATTAGFVPGAAGYGPTAVAQPYPGGCYTSRYALRPILPIQNVPATTYIDRGLIGQPKAYVEGQPLRNFLRYLTP